MSKFDIGVGEDFPLNDGPANGDREPRDWRDLFRAQRRAWREMRHAHHHHHHHHDEDDDGHARMAAMALFFALKAYRRRSGHWE